MGQGLTGAGWAFLMLGWGVIIALTVYCFSRVLFGKKRALSAGGEPGRDRWASRVGLILAMAGNAIGLGNFLRFPVKAAANGGGAFMIPYFVRPAAPGHAADVGRVDHRPLRRRARPRHHAGHVRRCMWKHPAGQVPRRLRASSCPFTIVIYYIFIESWTLGFAWFSGTGQYFGHDHAARPWASSCAASRGWRHNRVLRAPGCRPWSSW